MSEVSSSRGACQKFLCNSSSLRFIGMSCAGKHGLCQVVENICEHQRNFIIMKHVAVLPNHLSVVKSMNRKYNRLFILPLSGSGSGDKIVLGIYRMHIFTRHFRSVSVVCPGNPGSHIRFLFKDRVHCVAFFFQFLQHTGDDFGVAILRNNRHYFWWHTCFFHGVFILEFTFFLKGFCKEVTKVGILILKPDACVDG